MTTLAHCNHQLAITYTCSRNLHGCCEDASRMTVIASMMTRQALAQKSAALTHNVDMTSWGGGGLYNPYKAYLWAHAKPLSV